LGDIVLRPKEALHRRERRGRKPMKTAKRVAIALGSLLAVMLAGGAHFKL
jgi:hypothetical protein